MPKKHSWWRYVHQVSCHASAINHMRSPYLLVVGYPTPGPMEALFWDRRVNPPPWGIRIMGAETKRGLDGNGTIFWGLPV